MSAATLEDAFYVRSSLEDIEDFSDDDASEELERFHINAISAEISKPLPPSPKKKLLPVKRKLDYDELAVSLPVTKKATPPSKKAKNVFQFKCSLHLTKDVQCRPFFTLSNHFPSSSLPSPLQQSSLSLTVSDFAPRQILQPFLLLTSQNKLPHFKVWSHDMQTQLKLCFMIGLLTRKDDVAVIPLEGTEDQILLYSNDFLKPSTDNSSPERDQSLAESLDCTLYAIVVKRFTFVFDLDETLIRTRVYPASGKKQDDEHEFYVQGTRLLCCVRPGVDHVLKWACSLFNIQVFTNAVNEYAKKVIKILDPTRTTLLRNITCDEDEAQWSKLLKSREHMTTVDHLPKNIGLKELSKFDLNPYETVVLDDDSRIWKDKANVLPFSTIVSNSGKNIDFLFKLRCETWKLLTNLCLQRMKQQEKPVGFTYSQEHVVQNTKT